MRTQDSGDTSGSFARDPAHAKFPLTSCTLTYHGRILTLKPLQTGRKLDVLTPLWSYFKAICEWGVGRRIVTTVKENAKHANHVLPFGPRVLEEVWWAQAEREA